MISQEKMIYLDKKNLRGQVVACLYHFLHYKCPVTLWFCLNRFFPVSVAPFHLAYFYRRNQSTIQKYVGLSSNYVSFIFV